VAGTSPSGSGRAHFALGLLTVTYAFAYADRFLMAMLVQPIKADLRLSDSALGLLTGFAFFAFYATAGIPLGRLADRINRRMLLATSLAAWSIATATCGLAGSYLQLALSRMAVGVGEGGCAPASHSLISDLFPAGRRALPLGIFTAGGTLGMFGGFSAGGVLEATLGWRGAFWVLGGTGMLFVPILALALPEPRRTGVAPLGRPTPLRELLGTPGFVLLALSYSFLTVGLLGITQWLPAFYERCFGLNRSIIGASLATVGGLGAILGLVTGGWIADRISRRFVRWPLYQFVGATILVVPLQLAMLLVPGVNASFALAFVSMLIGWLGTGPALALIQTIAPQGARATATATVLVGSAVIGMGGGPLVVGVLSDAFHASLQTDSLRWALAGVAAVGGSVAAALGILATCRLKNERQTSHSDEHSARGQLCNVANQATLQPREHGVTRHDSQTIL
jgi:predicted MFS family arabinose efflux permease